MDVLLTFYIEGDLSNALKLQVEKHMDACPACRAKYDIVKSMISEMKNKLELDDFNSEANKNYTSVTSEQYRLFKNNLSAYVDNELSDDENVKIKKFTINNPNARQELETSYNLRKIMNDSFKKVQNDIKQDFSKQILKQLELEEEATSGFHPVIKLLVIFTLTVLILTSLVLISLSV